MPAPIPVYIQWVDSAQVGDTTWIQISDFAPISETICETLGWVISEDETNVYLAGSISPEEYGGIWQIPRVAIKKMHHLTL